MDLADRATVRLSDLLPVSDLLDLHRTPLLESHSVCSQLLSAMRTAMLWSRRPAPEPATVTLMAPVAIAELEPRAELTMPRICESAQDKVPLFKPAVTATCLLPNIADGERASNAVEETQVVASQPLCPNRPEADTALIPKPSPTTVICKEPVVGAFAPCLIPEAYAPYETDCEEVPD